jgi:hypothetical protein
LDPNAIAEAWGHAGEAFTVNAGHPPFNLEGFSPLTREPVGLREPSGVPTVLAWPMGRRQEDRHRWSALTYAWTGVVMPLVPG